MVKGTLLSEQFQRLQMKMEKSLGERIYASRQNGYFEPKQRTRVGLLECDLHPATSSSAIPWKSGAAPGPWSASWMLRTWMTLSTRFFRGLALIEELTFPSYLHNPFPVTKLWRRLIYSFCPVWE